MPGAERMPHASTAFAVVLFGVLTCAVPCAAQTPSRLEARIHHGHVLAQANCAACHAVEPGSVSPNRRAPPFQTLSGRYVELTLHQQLTEIAETGHYDMPPVPVHTDEVRAIVAYLNSLPAP
jgi:mono/diheme cytochrome c family protein